MYKKAYNFYESSLLHLKTEKPKDKTIAIPWPQFQYI